jgi:hypothetical protein
MSRDYIIYIHFFIFLYHFVPNLTIHIIDLTKSSIHAPIKLSDDFIGRDVVAPESNTSRTTAGNSNLNKLNRKDSQIW